MQKHHLRNTAGEAGKRKGEEKDRKTQEPVFQERKAGNVTQIDIVVNLGVLCN